MIPGHLLPSASVKSLRSTSAERMRRYRERAKNGSIVISFVLASDAVDRLVELRLLRADKRRDPHAVTDALWKIAERGLWG